jgi:hypothetical protein
VKYKPADGKWYVRPHAKAVFAQVRAQLGEEKYAENRKAFQEAMCAYFSTGSCVSKQGKFISPVAATGVATGAKCFKVRWLLPGAGKSGGLRLALVVYCQQLRVVVAGAWARKEDPKDEEFEKALKAGSKPRA